MRVNRFFSCTGFVLVLALAGPGQAQTSQPAGAGVLTETPAKTAPAKILAKTLAKAPTRTETLADIRQELNFLYVEIQRLRKQMSTTGPARQIVGGTEIERLNAIEGELQRLTGKVERMQFHIERIVKDGTNRIGDLEYRLVKLEGGDTSKLGETTTLGGDTQQIDTSVIPPDQTPGQVQAPAGNLAVGEKADFDAAKAAYDTGAYQKATDLLSTFIKNYPGSPLSAGAYYWRGEAFASLDEWSNAARSFLKSFSGAPESTYAARALYRLGVSLDKIGQRDEACLTLKEVGVRYPRSQPQTDASQEMSDLGCSG